MKLSKYGIIMIVITAITLILGITFRNFDGLLTEISVPLISLFLTIVSYQIFRATKDRGTLESKTWMFMFIGSLLNFVVLLVMSVQIIFPIGYTMPMYILEVILISLSYLSMIVGLVYSFRHYRSKKVRNPWIPFVVISVLAVAALVFSFGHFINNHFEVIFTFPFTIYLVSNIVLLFLSGRNAQATWGGKLSTSYILLASGFLAHVLNNVIVAFRIENSTLAAGIPLYQPFFIIGTCLLGLALDSRLMTEMELYKDSTPLSD